MGLFDKKDDDKKKEKKKADFSKVQSGSSTTARPEAKKAEGAKSYTVKSGDSLWKISEQVYGNGNDWRRIYEANKDRIQNPDVIQPGWVLTIPAQAGPKGETK
ncbi:MAG TPA: LysM peptidoglycan-binding domain-containing protein [Gemmatimonadota bacterium]|nr:LysM peptidoglycan-binding domain-containing protein [Gemmatimonadota bacterium]